MVFDSYACRIRKGSHRAIQRAQQFLRINPWVLKLDTKKYFFTIDHEILNRDLCRKISDSKVMSLIGQYVRYMDDALLFAQDKQKLIDAKVKIRSFLETRRLKLHELKSQVFPARHGVRFLGFHIYPNKLKISRPTLQRFKKRMKAKSWWYGQGSIAWENVLLSLNAWMGFADKQKYPQFINEVLSRIKFIHPDCNKAFHFSVSE